ncbi:MAG: TerD family protein [Bdellovibrionales bacterium]
MSDIFDAPAAHADIDTDGNFAVLGDDINIIEKDPTLTKVVIGAGWDTNAFDSQVMDLDVSVFLLNKDGMTRTDEDFVFYNMRETPDKAVRHHGDSRSGAGDGDDETITVDLQGISFEIMQVMIVLSIYKGYEREQDMSMVRNGYIRIVNADNDMEIVRFKLAHDYLEGHTETGMMVAALNREGPKWHFKPLAEFAPDGLGEIATKYGCIIKEQ